MNSEDTFNALKRQPLRLVHETWLLGEYRKKSLRNFLLENNWSWEEYLVGYHTLVQDWNWDGRGRHV